TPWPGPPRPPGPTSTPRTPTSTTSANACPRGRPPRPPPPSAPCGAWPATPSTAWRRRGGELAAVPSGQLVGAGDEHVPVAAGVAELLVPGVEARVVVQPVAGPAVAVGAGVPQHVEVGVVAPVARVLHRRAVDHRAGQVGRLRGRRDRP